MPSSSVDGVYLCVDTFPGLPQSSDARFVLYRTPRVLGFSGVVAITYFYGCGGPLGTEPLVSAAGPLLALVGMFAYWTLVTIPFAATVAELCSAFPDDGGFAVWGLTAFGPFWGFQLGYWSLVTGVINSAMYPGLLLDTVKELAGVEYMDRGLEYALMISIGVVLAVPAFASSRAVGVSFILLIGVVWMPLAVYLVWAFATSTDWYHLLESRHQQTTVVNATMIMLDGPVTVDWASLVNTLFWNFDGLHMSSVFAGQVVNPAKVYTMAIPVTAVTVVLTYSLPILATVATDVLPWPQFDRGAYVQAAVGIGGSALQIAMVVSTFTTIAGLYVCNLYCKAIEMAGMAEYRILPPVFARRSSSRCNSPYVGMLATLVPTLALVGINFDVLLPVTNVFGSLVALAILASNVQLRLTLPHISRPVQVPGGFVGTFAISIVPLATYCFILVTAVTGDWGSALLVLGFTIPGLVYGAYQSRANAAQTL